MFLRFTIRGMFADACSFESPRVKSARMDAFREKFTTLIQIRIRITTTKPVSYLIGILSRANSIKAGGKICNLCLEEKLQILRCCNSNSNLNKRSELFTKCVHARRFYAGRFKRTRVSKHTANSKT